MTKNHLLPIVTLVATVLAVPLQLQTRDFITDGALISQSSLSNEHGGCTSYLYYYESETPAESCWAASIECGWIDSWEKAFFVVSSNRYTWSSFDSKYVISTTANSESDKEADMGKANFWQCKDDLNAFGKLSITTLMSRSI